MLVIGNRYYKQFITCCHCNKLVIPKNPTRRYCSPACATRAGNKRHGHGESDAMKASYKRYLPCWCPYQARTFLSVMQRVTRS